MCTAIFDDGLFGRTLDLEFSYGENVVITPNEYKFNYLYEKDEYDPANDPDLLPQDDEDAGVVEQTKDGFELPDFLKDIEDGIIKIQ